jgi:hypothetical protein
MILIGIVAVIALGLIAEHPDRIATALEERNEKEKP